MTSFVLGMKGLTEGFTALSFLYYHHRGTQANGVIHGERPTGVGSDRMTEMVLLFRYRLMLVG